MSTIPDDIRNVRYNAPDTASYYAVMTGLIKRQQAFITRPLEMAIIVLDVRY